MSNHFYDQTFGLHTASDHLFLKTEEGDISHATFAAMTARLSNALVAAGMSVGDRVAVQAEKSATLLGVCAATIRAGGRICHSIPATRPPKLTISWVMHARRSSS